MAGKKKSFSLGSLPESIALIPVKLLKRGIGWLTQDHEVFTQILTRYFLAYAFFPIVAWYGDGVHLTVMKFLTFQFFAILFAISERVKGVLAIFLICGFMTALPYVFVRLGGNESIFFHAVGYEASLQMDGEKSAENPDSSDTEATNEGFVLSVRVFGQSLAFDSKNVPNVSRFAQNMINTIRSGQTFNPVWTAILVVLTFVAFLGEGMAIEKVRRAKISSEDMLTECFWNQIVSIVGWLAALMAQVLLGLLIGRIDLADIYSKTLAVVAGVNGYYALCRNRFTLPDGKKVATWEPFTEALKLSDTEDAGLFYDKCALGKVLPPAKDGKVDPNDPFKKAARAIYDEVLQWRTEALSDANIKRPNGYQWLLAWTEIKSYTHKDSTGMLHEDADFEQRTRARIKKFVNYHEKVKS